jgi:hypothetical protein
VTTENRDDVVKAIESLAYTTERIAEAITPVAMPGHDATDGTVASLTEAVMGATAGLVQIAEAIHDLAEAVRESKHTPFDEEDES